MPSGRIDAISLPNVTISIIIKATIINVNINNVCFVNVFLLSSA
jgi:hypothetical protein